MNNKKYNQIIDEAYKSYCKNVPNEIVNVGDTFIDTKRNLISTCKRKEIGTSKKVPILICEYEGCYIEEDCKKTLLQEEFVNKCKTDLEFSEKWGLKIEERELDMMERWQLAELTPNMTEFDFANYMCDKFNVPTRLITITYNSIKTDIYE